MAAEGSWRRPDEQVSDTGERPTDDSPPMVRLGAHRRYALAAALCRGTRILDVGCGTVGLWDYVKGFATTYQGLDRDVAVPHHPLPTDPRFHFNAVVNLLDWLSRTDQTWDTTVAIELIEHLDPGQQEAFLHALWRVTGERMILTTPHPDASRFYPLTDHFVGTHQNPHHTRELYPWQIGRYVRNLPDRSHEFLLYCSLEANDEQRWSTVATYHPIFGYAYVIDR